MDITKEHLMQFFKDASSYESIDPPCFNLEDFTEKWLEQAEGIEGKRLVKESDSLQPVSKTVCERSVSVDIVDSDIATIEVLHDLLVDANGYSLEFISLKRARELTAKMYKAFK